MTSPADLCGAVHPQRPDVTCDKDAPCWGYHESLAADLTWEGRPVPDKGQTKAEAERSLDATRQRTASAETTGPPVAVRPDPATVAAWEDSAGDWLSLAKRTLHDYCKGHYLFTTRDLWRLLPNPPGDDRRKMVAAIQHGVRSGWLAESGQYIRQTEPYLTSDGVRFPMNKAVPIYESRLWGGVFD